MYLLEQRTLIVKTANLLLPLVLYSRLKTQIFFVQTCIHYPDTISSLYTSPWPSPILPLGLDSDLWWEKHRHPGVRQEESPSVMGLDVLPTHCEAGACGGLYGPSDVENRETDPPLTTALCIQTHPRREALPVMATCPIYTYTNMNALRINQATHTHTLTHPRPWSMTPVWAIHGAIGQLQLRPCIYVIVWH